MTPRGGVDKASRALLFGNFAVGTGVMVATAVLNDLSTALQVTVTAAGLLISLAAGSMALGAPLLAAIVAGFDRRRLLALSLLGFGVGHGLSALAPDLAWLLPVRVVCVLGAAIFTPQAAAAIAVMAPPQDRGRVMTTVFLGFTASSVFGMPIAAYVGETLGWRAAFWLVAVLACVAAAWVWRAMPDGVRPVALTRANWQQVFTRPALMATVVVTAFSAAGQFTVFAYFAPYCRQFLAASPATISLLFLWFGVFGLVGNLVLTRRIDRWGAGPAVEWLLAGIALSLLLWPLTSHGVLATAMVITPWAIGCFASNSAQQARLAMAAPALAPALIALNSSAMYVGQAVGASGGGALITTWGYAPLALVGLGWVVAGIVLSRWAGRAGRPA